MKRRRAPRTAGRSSTRRSQGLRALGMGAKNYYGSSPKTIRKFVFFRIGSPQFAVFALASRAALSARSGLAFPKEAQLVLRDCKFGFSTIQANK
jgi:hypothetical protein